MLEISIFCVILFAIAYWATLFIMGRREDVLHGEFVEAEPEQADAAIPVAQVPVFPPKPVIKPKHAPPQPALPPVAVIAPEKPANTEALQSLLASLKQELKNAAQI
ncbi:MAG: hypothetical protein JO141_34370 [Bradyrhizobium sp.]|nr:hypothetical protein [Bradyrhizobium sp.]